VASSQIEELSEGLNFKVLHKVASVELSALAGMIKARSSGAARSTDEFDGATLLSKSRS